MLSLGLVVRWQIAPLIEKNQAEEHEEDLT